MMPPEGERLSKQEVAAITAWIDADALWPGSDDSPAAAVRDPRLDHWAWKPIAKPAVPVRVESFAAMPGVEAERNAIDFFIRATLAEKKLAPSAVADRRTLIRRASFDITGLPPTPAEVEAFCADTSPEAYEKLLEKLLASPRYGERMAADWLDLARYADSYGFQVDRERPMWQWRDWVISAFNRNMPFDQFTVEQLAGDMLAIDALDIMERHQITALIVLDSATQALSGVVHLHDLLGRGSLTFKGV
jgi:hypothetical protein